MEKTNTNIERLLQKVLREISRLRGEVGAVSELINADIRTADRLVSVREACVILGRKKSSVYALISSGRLNARRDGRGKYLLSHKQLQDYIHS